MNNIKRVRGKTAALFAALGLWAAAVPAAGAATPYPERPIRLIVPFGAGGTTDILGRVLGQQLGEALKQTVIVENRPGANGNIGSDAVAKAAPDGYTLLFAADATLVINPTLYSQLPFKPESDFAPISRIAVVPLVLVANPAVKADTLPELVKLGGKPDARLDFGSAGAGSMGHLVGERLNRATGMSMTHIPYKSGAQAISDVVSGQIPLLITGLAVAEPFLRDGKLKAIAVTSGQRFPGAPKVPTIAEGGVKDFDSPSWYGLLAPAGTPAPVLEKIHAALASALQTEDMKKRMVELGAWPVVDTQAAFAELIKADTQRWSQIIQAAGITVQ
ncbi:Bug family tripartite tricarboxylate transporter substrate binding protein [Bordetella bronchiseptica]|uniref:Bug family tripartite tricarboxylate transporter substrate binding protein n=1 Tax=Bordetella bronchiseptica TaxID=518 RepID=UPI000461A81B|nr:tripartite tricarboxylate transporter substrate binding protein [Bordetella bronchiseptica]AWP75169.1 hypothetical protein B7P10_12210 [Bordetella bronchiseptica]KDB91794.1 tripartite tricarboxylate transporter family receptor [Bordetella bronchiseptica D993]KDC02488.1 tripartite tricarboxylate transporter family receptor [Bordetella bronchiseptica E010]KDD31621.1 tripartite tricarboxylate transporter family receptor [Bordetella bronchiseptica MBORD839]KFJ70879.1 tripartite tricarboxylate t